MVDKAACSVLFACLIGALLFTACRSTGSSSAPEERAPDLTGTERILTQIEQTPDSLATLPRPLFYESSAPVRARPLPQSPRWSLDDIVVTATRGRPPSPSSAPPSPAKPAPPSGHVEVNAVGGTVNGQVRWGLHIHSVVPDTLDLRPFPFIDLFGQRLLLRREQAWRQLSSHQDSLHEERFVPLSMKDVQRLSRADTIRFSVNGEYYRIPTPFKEELQNLVAATPDSLLPDTVGIEERLRVYHNPETPPEPVGGPEALVSVPDYPSAAKRKRLTGQVRIGFLVERDGSTSHILVERGRYSPLIAEAVRVVKQFTFEPGTHRGQPVPTWRSLSFIFQIK